ncbi:MAG: hypothetical protein GC191_14805 [Azospirillum sp.]|nr:hypothetical protein [Azospirillum sp.]
MAGDLKNRCQPLTLPDRVNRRNLLGVAAVPLGYGNSDTADGRLLSLYRDYHRAADARCAMSAKSVDDPAVLEADREVAAIERAFWATPAETWLGAVLKWRMAFNIECVAAQWARTGSLEGLIDFPTGRQIEWALCDSQRLAGVERESFL